MDEGQELQHSALEKLETELAKQRNVGDARLVLGMLARLTVGYESYGDLDKALRYGTEAVETARLTADHLEIAVSMVNLGLVHRARGTLESALGLLSEARASLEALSRTDQRAVPHLANALNNLGLLDLEFGRVGPAALKFLKAIEMDRSHRKVTGQLNNRHFQQSEVNARSNLVHALRRLGRDREADEHWKIMLDLARQSGFKRGEAGAWLSFGSNLLEEKDYLGAVDKLSLALILAGDIQEWRIESAALHGIGNALSHLGRPVRAQEVYRRSIAIEEAHGQRGQERWLGPKIDFAVFLDTQGMTTEAAVVFEDAVAAVRDRLTSQIGFLSEREQIAFSVSVSRVFDRYFSFCVRHASTNPKLLERMLDVVLWQKGFVVANAAVQRAQITAAGEQVLAERLTDAKRRLSVAARMTGDNAEERTLRLRVAEEVLALERQLSARLASFRGDATDVTWQSVQRALRPGQAAVEIVRFRHTGVTTGSAAGRYVALVTTPGASGPGLVDLGSRDRILAALKDFATLTEEESPDGQSASAGLRATATLWTPLSRALGGAKTVLMAPDGELQKLNWLVLPVAVGRAVLDTHDVRLFTSTRDILRKPLASSDDRAIIFADPAFGPVPAASKESRSSSNRALCANWSPLKGAREEATNVDRLLRNAGWRVDLLGGADATEGRLKRVSRVRVLHLATHGCFLPDLGGGTDPMQRSFLAFAQANAPHDVVAGTDAEDGTLTAYEAASLALQGTELVVLSACETGLGDTPNSEGVFGLRRAFQLAGASAVLMSLWKVPDKETALLMDRFYFHWLASGDKHDALRQAQRDLRVTVKADRELQGKNGRFYWSAFILVGN